MIFNEIDYEIKPSSLKMIELSDLIKYCLTYNLYLGHSILLDNGFSKGERTWIINNVKEIKMQNNKIQFNINNIEIKNLNDIIIKLKQQLKLCNTNSINNNDININSLNNKINSNIIGWKGKDSLSIKRTDSDWIITEHRKSKSLGNIYKNVRYVPNDNVNVVWNILLILTDKENPTCTYRQIVSALMIKYNLSFNIEGFNGGRNRSKHLMPKYYYPLKILESLNLITYGSRGKITKLNFKLKKIE